MLSSAPSAPRQSAGGPGHASDRPTRSDRATPTTTPRVPSQPETSPAASSRHSAQTPPPPASAASLPQPMRINPPHRALYRGRRQTAFCTGSLNRFARLQCNRRRTMHRLASAQVAILVNQDRYAKTTLAATGSYGTAVVKLQLQDLLSYDSCGWPACRRVTESPTQIRPARRDRDNTRRDAAQPLRARRFL
jgi:hypothetical protein